jgi:hypothetical protein
MQEAWLLFDESAIRRAAGKPNGPQPLNLPRLRQLESVADPKEKLLRALRTASGLSGRRLGKFSANKHAHRLAQLIDDYSPLRELSAFAALEADVEQCLATAGLA